MERESHYNDESSATSIATKVFGWLIAVALIGGVAYVIYEKSGLDRSANISDAYDNCKSGILANMARAHVDFLNTPENTQVTEDQNGYTLVMKMRVVDGKEVRTSDYSCVVAKPKGGLQGMVHKVFG